MGPGDVQVQPQELGHLPRCRGLDHLIGAEEDRRAVVGQPTEVRASFVRSFEIEGLVGNAVAREEASDPLDRRVSVGPDHLQGGSALVEEPASAGGEDREDVVAELGDLGHQLEDRLPWGLEGPGGDRRAHGQRGATPIEERELPRELCRAEGALEHSSLGVGVDDLDLSLEHVDEAVRGLPHPSDDRPGFVGPLLADPPDRFDVAGGQGNPLHHR